MRNGNLLVAILVCGLVAVILLVCQEQGARNLPLYDLEPESRESKHISDSRLDAPRHGKDEHASAHSENVSATGQTLLAIEGKAAAHPSGEDLGAAEEPSGLDRLDDAQLIALTERSKPYQRHTHYEALTCSVLEYLQLHDPDGNPIAVHEAPERWLNASLITSSSLDILESKLTSGQISITVSDGSFCAWGPEQGSQCETPIVTLGEPFFSETTCLQGSTFTMLPDVYVRSKTARVRAGQIELRDSAGIPIIQVDGQERYYDLTLIDSLGAFDWEHVKEQGSANIPPEAILPLLFPSADLLGSKTTWGNETLPHAPMLPGRPIIASCYEVTAGEARALFVEDANVADSAVYVIEINFDVIVGWSNGQNCGEGRDLPNQRCSVWESIPELTGDRQLGLKISGQCVIRWSKELASIIGARLEASFDSTFSTKILVGDNTTNVAFAYARGARGTVVIKASSCQ